MIYDTAQMRMCSGPFHAYFLFSYVLEAEFESASYYLYSAKGLNSKYQKKCDININEYQNNDVCFNMCTSVRRRV